MSAGWVAAGVRARGLARRRLGQDGIGALSACHSLPEALSLVSAGPYGRAVRPDMDLGGAGRAVVSVLLWHLRILAGWGPPMSAGTLRALAGGFEIDNVAGHLARLSGGEAPDSYVLGSLSTAWSVVSSTDSPAALRAALATTTWGDPGGEDPATIVLGMQVAWARRVLDVPGAGDWAVAAAALVVAKVVSAGALAALGQSARRDTRRLLGARWEEASSLDALRRSVPRVAGRALEEVNGPEDLWRAEERWWDHLERSAARLAGGPVTEESTCVGVVGLLAADAWRTRRAVELAARGGSGVEELVDALA